MASFSGSDLNLFRERMLEHGFLPEGLPPVFRIENLHEASLKPVSEGFYLTEKPTECCKFSASKRGGQRRTFSIPNPICAVDLAIFFSKHERQIEEHLQLSTVAQSQPLFSINTGLRPIQISSFQEFHRTRRTELSQSRYIVRTDISRFFHSIYTHTIPWALHGKSLAKKDRSPKSDDNFGNALDWIIRQAQDGQTVGIPVGPDFSRIVSEVIATAIDRDFGKKHGHDIPYTRLVDDIFIGADNIDEANSYLRSLRDSIQSYELDINESKTSIIDASADIEPYWPVEIRRELDLFSECGVNFRSKSDFTHLLDEILRLSTNNRDDGIIKYSIKQIDKIQLWTKFWDILEPFLFRIAINFPHCWEYIAKVASWRSRTSSLDSKRWQSVIHRSALRHASSGNDFEVAWALWLLKEIAQPVDQDLLSEVLRKCGPIPCMLVLDIHRNVGSSYKFPKEELVLRLGEKPMTGSNWMLAYEADRQFGIKIKTKNLQGNDFFRQMYDDDVSFYDSEAIPQPFKGADSDQDVIFAIESTSRLYDDLEENEITT